MDVDELFRKEAPKLRRYLGRLVGDSDVAEDVLQETFVRAMERRGDSAARSWLYTVATNLVRDRARSRERHDRLADRVPQPRADPTHKRAEAGELRERLRSALEALSHRERSAVLLRHEGYAQREIAEILGTTTGTIGTLTARALRKLAASDQLKGFRP